MFYCPITRSSFQLILGAVGDPSGLPKPDWMRRELYLDVSNCDSAVFVSGRETRRFLAPVCYGAWIFIVSHHHPRDPDQPPGPASANQRPSWRVSDQWEASPPAALPNHLNIERCDVRDGDSRMRASLSGPNVSIILMLSRGITRPILVTLGWWLWRTHGSHRLIHIPMSMFPAAQCSVSPPGPWSVVTWWASSLSSPGALSWCPIISGTIILMRCLMSRSEEFSLIGTIWGIDDDTKTDKRSFLFQLRFQ